MSILVYMWKINVDRYIFLRVSQHIGDFGQQRDGMARRMIECLIARSSKGWLWPEKMFRICFVENIFSESLLRRAFLSESSVVFYFATLDSQGTSLHQYNRCLNVAIQTLQWGELCWQNRPNAWLLRQCLITLVDFCAERTPVRHSMSDFCLPYTIRVCMSGKPLRTRCLLILSTFLCKPRRNLKITIIKRA